MSLVEEENIDEALRFLVEAAQETSSLQIDGSRAVDPTSECQNEDLDTCLQRLMTKVLNLMTNRNRVHNRTRPLNRLPIEILVKVLTLALQDDITRPLTYMKNLRMFASVSYEWLLLVKETPSL
ncbi:hypothetical protein FRB94_003010 [Tulasnella sp. JGI-2019a]|nr:hypothetical protein FRB94_003010 [Tulasnella sp. JGI-2019a]